MHKYPKLLLLVCSFVLAYFLYHVGALDWLGQHLNGHGYVSVFLGGLLFSFGFTTAFGIAIFIEMAPHVNPVYAALIGGLGALLSDLCIFNLLRFATFHDEVHRLKSMRLFLWLRSMLHHESVSERMRKYLLWSFAGLVIASPLPDEFGVTLLSSVTELKERQFAVICFAFNMLGIFIILLLGEVIGM